MNAAFLKHSTHALLLCALCVWSYSHASVTSAHEQSGVRTRSKVVWFGDLNLSNPEGVTALYRRIRAAAHQLCTDRSARTRQIWSKAESQCQRAAIADAVEAVHNDRLTAMHREEMQRRNG